MISWLRNFASSIVAKLLIALLVVSFAAWGVGDYLRGGSVGAVAQVGDEEISVQDFQREFNMALQQFGGQVTPQQARMLGLDQNIVQRMAGRLAMDQETLALGVDAPTEAVDAFIREVDAFKNPAGDFDQQAFEYALRQVGLRTQEFHDNVRRDLARSALIEAVQGASGYPRVAAETVWRFQNETRNLDYLIVDGDDIEDPAAPTDAELRAYHEEQADRFTAPEYRTVTYLWLRAEDHAEIEDVGETALRDAYESEKERYERPERRNIEQIVYDDEEAAKAAAARVLDGETFEQVATDRGLSPTDIALGYITRDELFDEDSASAVFGDVRDGLVGPIPTNFGWSLFNIEGVIEAETTTFEEAREDLARELAIESARGQLPDLANAVEDARAGGAELLEIGRREELTSAQVTIDAQGFDPDGAPVANLPTDPSFLNRAFELEIGEEIDLVELPGLEYFVVQVDDIQDPALRPFDTVEAEVEAAWTDDARRDAVAELASDLVDRLTAGETIAAIAESFEREPQRFEGLGRSGATGDLSADVVASAFDAEAGDAFSAPTAGGAASVVARLDAVVEADPATAPDEIAIIVDQAGASIDGDLLGLFQAAALTENGFLLNMEAIDLALTGGQGGHGGM